MCDIYGIENPDGIRTQGFHPGLNLDGLSGRGPAGPRRRSRALRGFLDRSGPSANQVRDHRHLHLFRQVAEPLHTFVHHAPLEGIGPRGGRRFDVEGDGLRFARRHRRGELGADRGPDGGVHRPGADPVDPRRPVGPPDSKRWCRRCGSGRSPRRFARLSWWWARSAAGTGHLRRRRLHRDGERRAGGAEPLDTFLQHLPLEIGVGAGIGRRDHVELHRGGGALRHRGRQLAPIDHPGRIAGEHADPEDPALRHADRAPGPGAEVLKDMPML